jgi:hypothetical protein
MSKKTINLDRVIKNLRGEEVPTPNPRKEDIEKIRKEKNIIDVKIEDLPKETVRDVILTCLSVYKVTDRRDIFYVNQIASWAMEETKDGEDNELKDKLFKFLTDSVLTSAIIFKDEREDIKKESRQKGSYYSWVIAQVYDELGITE